jgi:peptidyl-prolyl cis-trans isomerase D
VLDLMRKHARSWLIKIALIVICIVFVFWYGWSGSGGQAHNYLANVNGTKISQAEFQREVDAATDRLKQRFQDKVPPNLEKELHLKKTIAERLISQTLLVQEAKKLGLFVTDQDLIDDIKSNPMFQRNGVFDENLYTMALREEFKMSPSTYEKEHRKDLLVKQAVNLLIDSVKTTPEEIKAFWHFQDDKLHLAMLLVKADEQKQNAAPDPKALEHYFEKHKTHYQVSPKVTVQYVSFSWRNAAKQVSVSDEEARKYFANHPKEYIIPEKFHIRQILIKVLPSASKAQAEAALKKIKGIRAKIKAEGDFATLAKKESQDETSAAKGGDLGFFNKHSLAPQIEKVAEQLQPGQVSQPIRTAQGYHLIFLVEKKPEVQLEFSAVKDKIIKHLVEEKAKKKISSEANAFYEKVYRAEDLEGPAKKFGFQVHKAGPVSKEKGIPELSRDPKIMDEAFQLTTNEISRMVHSGDNYVVMKLLEKQKERIPSLAEIRAKVEQDYLKQQALLAAQKKAADIIAALKKPLADPQAVAQKFGLKWEELPAVARPTTFVQKLGSGPQVTDMLTSISKAAPVFPTPITVPAGAAIVRLVKLEAASRENYSKEAPALEMQVLQWRRAEFLNGWLKVLTDKSKIDVNEKLL